MSIVGASGSNIIVHVEGTPREFRRPTRNDVAAQINRWAAEDKELLLKLLQESGSGPEIRLAMLKQHADESRRMQYGLSCLFHVNRALQVVSAAYVGGADAFSTVPMAFDRIIELACELWSFGDLFDKKPAKDTHEAKDGDSRPLEGGVAVEPDPTNSTGISATPS